jgi:uncharacterized C2H2 Zn-finger protein
MNAINPGIGDKRKSVTCLSDVNLMMAGGLTVMHGNISKCIMCGQFFDSKRKLKEHIDKNHRITDSKIVRKQNNIKKRTL